MKRVAYLGQHGEPEGVMFVSIRNRIRFVAAPLEQRAS
jgi:hypothetical protein